MTVIFTQIDYTANFTTAQRTISDFNLGSVAGGMLILFLNDMKKFHVSITNTNFYAVSLIPDKNQVGRSGITIHSYNCSSGTLDHPSNLFGSLKVNHKYQNTSMLVRFIWTFMKAAQTISSNLS